MNNNSQATNPSPLPQNERVGKTVIMVGTNGTGKTTMLRQILHNSGQRALIVTPDDVEWQQYPETPLLAADDFVFDGIRRHIFSPRHTLEAITHFRKGIIVFDDCRSYLGDKTDERIRDLFIRKRQRELDVFAVAHGFTQVPPVFFTFATDYFVFHTLDNIVRRKNCITDDSAFERIKQAQAELKKEFANNPHAYRRIKVA